MAQKNKNCQVKKSIDVAQRLFPTDLSELKWVDFSAEGFSESVAGMIFRTAHPTCCGVPLGGLGTGCLDIETSGVFGFSTLFPASRRHQAKLMSTTRNPQLCLPFLGLSLRDETWILTSQKFIDGGAIMGCTEPVMEKRLIKTEKDNAEWIATWQSNVPRIEGAKAAEEIHYWGHYPVADLEYEIDSPVSIGLRAWAPFIPGDLGASSIPGAVFDVHLRNTKDTAQKGTLAFSFPGPAEKNPKYKEFIRAEVEEKFVGVTVSSKDGEIGYALGVIGKEKVRFGSGLHSHPAAWSRISSELPSPQGRKSKEGMIYSDSSTSLAVDFELKPKEAKTIHIVLTWYAPQWTGAGYKEIIHYEPWGPGPYGDKIPGRENEEGIEYTAMYATRYESALDVARRLAQDHASLLRRILAWQQAIYVSKELPAWLQDCLVNNLSLIPEDSYWAQSKKPLGDWSFPEGAFGLIECPRACPVMGCIVSNWYGDLPILYFFPELEKMILRNYREYMRPDGAVPFFYPDGDWTKPSYEWLLPQNGNCFVDLVGRLWLRTGDDDILQEFYSAIKKNTIFTMNLKSGPEGLISVYKEGVGQLWWEATPAFGMVTHIAGIRLSTLAIAHRMAERMGDEEFAEQCQEWSNQASQQMEKKLWAGDTYLFYNDPKSGKKSDDILSSQLDGEWASLFHGLPGVFRDDRVKKTLETIQRTCLVDCGLVGFATHTGEAKLTTYGTFPPEINITGMTYIYHGQREAGLEIVRRNMDNLVRQQRHGWDLPNLIHCDTGERVFGTDYFQNMILWALPAALQGEDLSGPCQVGGLIDRIIKAGREAKSTG